MTARALTILKQMGQTEATQSKMRIKYQARNILGTRFQKQDVEQVYNTKAEAKIATMCAQKDLWLAV